MSAVKTIASVGIQGTDQDDSADWRTGDIVLAEGVRSFNVLAYLHDCVIPSAARTCLAFMCARAGSRMVTQRRSSPPRCKQRKGKSFSNL